MKKSAIAVMAIGVVVCLVGVILVVVAATNGVDVNETWQQQSYLSTTKIAKIDLSISAGKVNIQYYSGDSITVEYSTSNFFTTKITENNGTLKIRSNTQRYWVIGGIHNFPETSIYIPNDSIVDLDLVINAGAVNISSVAFDDVEIKMNAGEAKIYDVYAEKLTVDINAGTFWADTVLCDIFKCDISAGNVKMQSLRADMIDVDVSAGSATIGVDGIESEYSVFTSVSAGSCNLKSHSGTSSAKRINVDVSAGSVAFTFKKS